MANIKGLKDRKFDVFYKGTKYIDYKNLSYLDLIKLLSEIEEIDGTKWQPIFWKTEYSEAFFYNLLETFKRHNYIVCNPNEIERDFHLFLHGESSLYKELAESNYRINAEKAKEKEKKINDKATVEAEPLLAKIKEILPKLPYCDIILHRCKLDLLDDKLDIYYYKSNLISKIRLLAYYFIKNEIINNYGEQAGLNSYKWNDLMLSTNLMKILDKKIKRERK